jgi:DNA polymerase-3 subunit delta'
MESSRVEQPRVREWITKTIAKNRMVHAYLFEGKKGSGKKALAIVFAQSLFCLEKASNEPCLTCRECIRIQHRNHSDVHWVEPEGMSIKIEQVRLLQKEFSYRGVENNKKVYIIDRIETMTTQAANSLLKFLEEPHPGTMAILLTEQRHRLLPTIISRCQEIKFMPPSPSQLIGKLSPEFGQSLAYLSSHITADLEEATNLCQSEWFAEIRNLMIQLVVDVQQTSNNVFFSIQDKWLKITKDKEQIDTALELLLLWYKDLLYSKLQLKDKFIYIEQTELVNKQALLMSQERVTKGIEAILGAKRRLHANVNPQLLLEQLVLRLKED